MILSESGLQETVPEDVRIDQWRKSDYEGFEGAEFIHDRRKIN